jgi:hypothetical protein
MKLRALKFKCVKSTNDIAHMLIKKKKIDQQLFFLTSKLKVEEQWEKNGFQKKEIYF